MLIWKAENDGTRTFINSSFSVSSFSRFGRKNVECTNNNWLSIIHPDDLNGYLKKYNKALKFGKPFRTIYRVLNENSEYRWILEIGMSLNHINSDFTGYIGASIDITMYKTIKGGLRRKLQIYRNAFETSNLTILVLEPEELSIVSANLAAEKFYGYTKNQLKKMKITELITETDINKDIKKIIEEKQHVIFSAQKLKNNEIKYARVYCSLIQTEARNFISMVINENIDNSEILAQLAYKDYHDELTDLYNRKYLELELKRLNNKLHLPLSIIIGDVNNMKLINNTFGYNKGDEVLRTIAQVLKNSCRKGDIICRTGGDEFTLILPETNEKDAAKICSRIKEKCKYQEKGLLKYDIALGTAVKTKMAENITDICKEAEDKMYKNKLSEGTSLRSSLIDALKKTIEERTWETEAHAERMKDRALKLGKLLNLSRAELDELALLAILHDIGKIGIPDSILSKKGPLTDEEREIMKKHSEIGYRIAAASPELWNIANAILYHHEYWDGSGYPYGLKGEEIPITSRIISVIDAYDAMTNDRVYHAAISKEKAIEEIIKFSGKQFDPKVVKIFLKMMKEDE